MATRLPRQPLYLQVDDRQVRVRTAEGAIRASWSSASGRAGWVAALRGLAGPDSPVHLLLGQGSLRIECQETPYLSSREQQEVAGRLVSEERAEGPVLVSATQDADPVAEGGHALWAVSLPYGDLDPLTDAILSAGLRPVQAVPFQRAVLLGLEGGLDGSSDHVVLVAEPGQGAHLLIFHGRCLVIQRSFPLPALDADASETLFIEISRLLQFYKQKHRKAAFEVLHVVGMAELDPALAQRLQTGLRLGVRVASPEAWAFLHQGMLREGARRDGLNLLPKEILEAARRRVFRMAVWGAAGLMFLLLATSVGFMVLQERVFREQANQAEALLAQREEEQAREDEAIRVRMPFLRARAAEVRQKEAIERLGRLGQVLFETPAGLQLDRVEVMEDAAGGGTRFMVKGVALSEGPFSVGPLAAYLRRVEACPGVVLQPLQEVQVSDRVDEATGTLAQRAVTRFSLEGRLP